MTNYFRATAAITFLTLTLSGCQRERVGDTAVDFSLPNVRGGEFRYSPARHRNLLVAFLQTQPDMGSEHNPSRSAVPFLLSMDHQYRRAGLDVVIVDETALATYAPVAGKIPSMHALLNTSYHWALTIPLLADPDGKVAGMYGVKHVPTLILINSAGRIAERWDRMPHPGVLAWGIQRLVGGPGVGSGPTPPGDPSCCNTTRAPDTRAG